MGGYFCIRAKVDKMIVPCKDDFSWMCQVEEVFVEDDKLIMKGFAFDLETDAEEKAYDIVLQDVESKEFVFLRTKSVQREDVTSYFACEYDYLNSGFVASVSKKKISYENKEYEVLLRPAKSQKVYHTGTYISQGNLAYITKREQPILDVEGTELEKVVEDGVLRISLPELGFCAYQYDGVLYGIMEEKYKEQERYYRRLVVRYYTNQLEKLPEKSIVQGVTTDTVDVYFDDTKTIGKYYVCEVVLPEAYAVTRMDVGNYYEGWVWQEKIRPIFNFE